MTVRAVSTDPVQALADELEADLAFRLEQGLPVAILLDALELIRAAIRVGNLTDFSAAPWSDQPRDLRAASLAAGMTWRVQLALESGLSSDQALAAVAITRNRLTA